MQARFMSASVHLAGVLGMCHGSTAHEGRVFMQAPSPSVSVYAVLSLAAVLLQSRQQQHRTHGSLTGALRM